MVQRTKLKKEVLQSINNVTVIGRLMNILNVGERTVKRFIDDNNPTLTQWDVLQYLHSYTSIAIKDLLTVE